MDTKKCTNKSTKTAITIVTVIALIMGAVIATVLLIPGDTMIDDASKIPVCERSLKNEISKHTHFYATNNNIEVSKIGFSSCISPDAEGDGTEFWKHVRKFDPDLWLWLGDNTYDDIDHLNVMENIWDDGTIRLQYNKVRENPGYVQYGFVSDNYINKTPVMATWDDHDAGTYDDDGRWNNDDCGSEEACLDWNQDEFVNHFNIPKDDPIHKEYDGKRQYGVYNSRMFLKPGTKESGIHVIMLDGRSGRDPTIKGRTMKAQSKPCKGTETQQLSDEQWNWLDEELSKKSVIKVIGSGVQVLPPTNQLMADYYPIDEGITSYCAHDIHSDSRSDTKYDSKYCTQLDESEFCKAITDVGENHTWVGTVYEGWSLIPQERRKLLQKVQVSLNRGNAQSVIFVSGDQHWAELMVKRMPRIPYLEGRDGDPQTLYEITASGIFQNFVKDVSNSNRLKDNSEDKSIFRGNCHASNCFPAADVNERVFGDGIMCSTNDTSKEEYTICDPIDPDFSEEHLSAESNLTMTCTNSKYHPCRRNGNYGGISVDFEKQLVTLSIQTPETDERAEVVITY